MSDRRYHHHVEEQLRRGPSLLESLWRYRLVVIGVTLLMGVAGYVVGTQEEEQFQASAELFLADPNSGLVSDVSGVRLTAEDYVPRQAARIRSRAVLSRAVESTRGRMTVAELADALDVEASVETLSMRVIISGSTPEAAAELANAVALAYRDRRSESEESRAQEAVSELQSQNRELVAERDRLQELLEADPENGALQFRIQSLDNLILDGSARIDNALLQVRLVGDGVELFEEATPPDYASRPRPRLTAISFAFLGAILAAMWSYWYAFKSQRVMNRNDPEKVLGVPPLGEIPLYRTRADDALTGLLRIDPAAAEAYEFVLSSIEFALADLDGKSLMITSTLPGDGKTTTSLQLAIAASRDRRRVVLVDADIRARGLTRVLGADERTGLSDLAALDLHPSHVLRRYRFSESSQIPVVTAGQRRGDPAALLRTRAFRQAMTGISDSAEMLIVDSSPLLAVADATIVAGSVDGIVIVVSHGTPLSELEKVRERLKFVSTPVLGYIFNRSDSSTAGAYGYGYGFEEDLDGEHRMLPRNRAPGRKRRSERTSGGQEHPNAEGQTNGHPTGSRRTRALPPAAAPVAGQDGASENA